MRIHTPPLPYSPWPFVVGAATLVAIAALSAYAVPRTPRGLPVVRGFDLERYMGHWYEVARIDNHYERGLSHATATYTANRDGTVEVVNRGYDTARKRWKEVVGVAKFRDESSRAALKVSFFGPFYAGYHVVALDEDYQWAMVVGSSRDYLWILSRAPVLPRSVREHLIDRAQSMGVDVRKIRFATEFAGPPLRGAALV